MQHHPHTLPATINPDWRIGIVYSFYYQEVQPLVTGAVEQLKDAGILTDCISEHPVLGSFEIPLIGAALAKNKQVDALIGIGIIVQGQTRHADHLAREVSRGIMDVQLTYQLPFAYEVLHVQSLDQLKERSEGEGNKGREAALATLHALAQLPA